MLLTGQIDLPYKHEQTCSTYRVYLDSNFQLCRHTEAKYYIHSLEYNGRDVWLDVLTKWKGRRHQQMHITQPIISDSLTALSGVVRWYSGKKCVAEEQYLDGYAIGEHRVWDKKGNLIRVDDYDKTTDGNRWSCSIEKYRRGELIRAEMVQWDFAACKWKTICTFGCMKHPSQVIAP